MDKNLNKCIRQPDTNKERPKANSFEREVYRRILGPVYENEKENWTIITNKEIYAMITKPL